MSGNKGTSGKRLARAKVASGSNDKGASDKAAKGTARRDGGKKPGKGTQIAIVVFGIVMALSMMLPSLSAIFAGSSSSSSQSSQKADSASTTDSSDSSSSTTSSMASVDAKYSSTVSELEAKLKEKPKSLATLLNLGNDYMAWAYSASTYATDDTSKQHVNDLFQKAMGYYDQYLALNDSSAVRVNRALCQYYSGDVDGAKSALLELTQSDSTYGPAWANLGLMYESSGDTANAKSAYQKAEEADANDEYGAKSFAEQRLSVIASQEAEASDSSSSSTTTSGSTTQGLSETLANSSGTNL
ncbi:MAG: hypothetical protein LKJ49_05500 [Olsenella sp.]|jgi:Flp pilus assembly protein TadD|nr:hypothetical protein [Olsenella sp.]